MTNTKTHSNLLVSLVVNTLVAVSVSASTVLGYHHYKGKIMPYEDKAAAGFVAPDDIKKIDCDRSANDECKTYMIINGQKCYLKYDDSKPKLDCKDE